MTNSVNTTNNNGTNKANTTTNTSNTINKKFLEVLKNAYLNGNRKTLGTAPIEASLRMPFDVYRNTMLVLQSALHEYVLAIADESNTKAQVAAKTKVFDLLKALVDRVGCVCDATDILYLELAAYKVAKSKDTENEDGSITSGTKALVTVSSTVFRGLVESLLGNKIVGKTWDSAMGSFRELNKAEREKLAAKIAKREAKAQGKTLSKPAAVKPADTKAPAVKAETKPEAKKDTPKKPTTKPEAKIASAAKADLKPSVQTEIKVA